MKKIIGSILVVSLIFTQAFASIDNNSDTQVFMSKTNGLTSIGETEELFVGTQEDFSKESPKIFTREESVAVGQDSTNTGMTTENAVQLGLGGAAAVTIAVAGAAAKNGQSFSDGMKSGGLIGLAVVGATVAGVAAFNGTQGMRDDKKYIALFRNKVGNQLGLIYVIVVANNTTSIEEVRKLALEKIRS